MTNEAFSHNQVTSNGALSFTPNLGIGIDEN